MTPYDALRHHCGLSQREAAGYHSVSADTVKSWTSGRSNPRPGVFAELRDLAALIDQTADQALIMLDRLPESAEVEIGYPADDHEARSLGMPCVGAWRAMIGQVIAGLDRPVVMVPRGSTAPSAAASDAREL